MRENLVRLVAAAVIVSATLAAGESSSAPTTSSAPAGKIALDQPTSIPSAGIRLALPKGFAPGLPLTPSTILRVSASEADEEVIAVTLSAVPVKNTETADSLLRATDPRTASVFSDAKELRKQDFDVAGLKGRVQLITFSLAKKTAEGKDEKVPITAARLAFVRPLSSGQAKIGYLLAIEAGKSRVKDIIPLLGAISTGIELSDPVNPLREQVKLSSAGIVSDAMGFAFYPPQFWRVATSPDRADTQFALTDMVTGQTVMIGTLKVQNVGDKTAKDIASYIIDHAEEQVKDKKMTVKVLKQENARMGGEDGMELAFQPVSADGKGGDIFVQRLVVKDKWLYALGLHVLDSTAADAGLQAMQTMSEGMRISGPTSAAPASQPTRR